MQAIYKNFVFCILGSKQSHCVHGSFVPLQVLSEVGEEFISVRNARLQSFVGAVILGPLDDGGVLVLLHHGHPSPRITLLQGPTLSLFF